jgi:uncharacterized protein
MVDTHEHLNKEAEWVDNGPGDVLADLFSNYVPADFIAARVNSKALQRLTDVKDPDLEGRWNGVKDAWDAIRLTGYGEAVRLIAKHVYDIDEISGEAARKAAPKLQALRKPGERLRLLRDVAKLEHTQTDHFVWPSLPDKSGPEFFLYDLSWRGFCNGEIDSEGLAKETGTTIYHLRDLRAAMDQLFAKYGKTAVAVKAQHAYSRTLNWEERTDADAERALQAVLKDPKGVSTADRLCLGDWCWSRGIELAIQYNRPFKIHTGYYAGNGVMPVDRIPAGNLCALLKRYPEARFVLMHIAYPYSGELIALVKHYRNAYADLCWAWSIDPHSSVDFVRRYLHAAPANKLFAFGGDTRWPTSAYAYALQARKWLTRALEAEVKDGELKESQAIKLAQRLMQKNQHDCFDIQDTVASIKTAMKAA